MTQPARRIGRRALGEALNWPDLPLFVVLCIAWGFSFIAIKEALVFMQPVAFAAARLWGATFVLLAWTVIRRQSLRLPVTKLLSASLLGVINLGLVNVLTALALGSVPAGLGSVLLYTYPLIAAVLAAVMLKDRLGLKSIVGLILGFAGVALISGPGGRFGLGTLLMLGAAAAWAIGSVMFKVIASRQDLYAVTAWSGLAAATSASAWTAFTEGVPEVRLTWALAWSLAYAAVIASGAAWILWYWLLERGQTAVVSGYLFLTPVFSLGFGVVLLGEQIRFIEVVGIAAVLGGIFFVNNRTEKRTSRQIISTRS